VDDDDDAGVQSSGIANDAFFKTGEEDVSALLEAMTALFSRAVRLDSVLDFGCGAGRLTLPLARRAGNVVACDIAPTMLLHARKNAERAGLRNIAFKLCDDAIASAGPSFDFVCSLLVFQYIPPSVGYGLIRSLTRRLTDGGVAALQLRLRRGRRRFASRTGPSRAAPTPRPFAQTYKYDEGLVARAVERAGAAVVARLPAGGRRTDDAVLIVRKS
jgi:SAM-dependent methyltransferase